MSISKWACTVTVVALFVGQASAANLVAAGKVKSIDADKKQFVLTDSADKDWTISFGENVLVNRGGKETATGLKVGDPINVCYQKGVLVWTAHYILVLEGDSKNSSLLLGAVKSYDADTKELTIKDSEGKSRSFAMGDAKVRLNKDDSRIDKIKVGDQTLMILDTADGKTTLKCLMADRK